MNNGETKTPWRSFLEAAGPVAQLCRDFDWAQTPLGPVETWDHALLSTVGTLLRSTFPTFISWGSERTLLYNDAYSKILGPVKHPKALGARFETIWSEVWTELLPIIHDVDRGVSRYFENLRLIVDRTGRLEEAFFTFSYGPLLNDRGEVAGLICHVVETTQAVRATRDLEKAERQVTDILENTNDGFFAIDKNWIVTRVNTNHEVFTEKKREEQLGRSFLDLFFPGGQFTDSLYWKSYHRAMTERVSVVFEDYYEPLKLWTAVSVYPQPDGGLAVFFRRINEEKRIQQELLKAKEEAERANHLKSAFLANMSHEIRTPLGAMMGFADLLRDPGLSEGERANYVDILHKNGDELGRVINDILDLSKVETGHIDFEFLPASPLAIAQDVVSFLSVLAREKGLFLSLEHDDAPSPALVTDATRVKQILMNLVGNAIKFTKTGSVRLSVRTGRSENGLPRCTYQVIDTGIGVAAEAAGRLFKVFTQADNSMTRNYGGTGLGLALSRSLARAMGGEVRLVHSDSRGSVFELAITSRETPSRAAVAPQPTESPPPPARAHGELAGYDVLLVDDAPDNRQLISIYLRKQGASVDVATNGLEGRTKALAKAYDIVLMDLQMPVMDGYTATEKLRAAGYDRPIIALTAHAMSDVRQKCEAVGFTTHLPKPINPGELIRTIAKLVGRKSAPAVQA